MILGLDVGGTNIDACLVLNNKIIKTIKKEISNNLEDSIFNTIKELTFNIDKNLIKTINLSTTIITNSIYLNNINKVGLICQSGPGLPNELLKITNEQYFVSGYINHLGNLVKDINEEEILKIKDKLLKSKIKDIAIISKFSTRNKTSEENIKKLLKDDFNNITLGHEISGKLNYPRRINSAYLNASIKDIFLNFKSSLLNALKEININANINILKADGGNVDINYATKLPLETILSGPAASLMGVNYLYETNKDSLILDIGGTTTDIFFLKDGISLFEPVGIKIKEFNTLIRSVYSKSIPYGGDSIVSFVNKDTKLLPKRLDKAYAYGGKYITLTDCLLYKENDLAKEGIKMFSKKYNINEDYLVNNIINQYNEVLYNEVNKNLLLINEKPVYTINEILNYNKLNLKEIILIGGPSELLKSHLKDTFNINIVVLNNYSIANAIGAAYSIPSKELNLYLNTKINTLTIPELNIYKKINSNYTKEEAKSYLISKLKEESKKLNLNNLKLKYEITLEEEFNIIDDYYNEGLNLRLKAQIKPGVLK